MLRYWPHSILARPRHGSAEIHSRFAIGGALQTRPASLVATLAALGLVGCSSALLSSSGKGEEARFQHRELGYEIAYPSVLMEPGWHLENLDQSDLLVRHDDTSAWAMASNCRATAARIETLAAELGRATGGTPIDRGGPVMHQGLGGWAQRHQRSDGSVVIEIKTVTLRGRHCTYDWIFLAPNLERFESLEPAFDSWWLSFEPGPRDRPEEGDP